MDIYVYAYIYIYVDKLEVIFLITFPLLKCQNIIIYEKTNMNGKFNENEVEYLNYMWVCARDEWY